VLSLPVFAKFHRRTLFQQGDGLPFFAGFSTGVGGRDSTSRCSRLEMKFQAAAHRAGRCVLDGNLFALFGDFVDAVADVSDVDLKVKVARLGLPQRQSRRQVRRKCCGRRGPCSTIVPLP